MADTRQVTAELRVAIIGAGAIGSALATELDAGRIDGARLSGVAGRVDGAAHRFADLLDASDVVVEAAGHTALAAHGPATVAAGRQLVVISVGALADDELRARVLAGPGRAHLVTGALGGIDALAALARAGGLHRVALRTTKPGPVLIRPWMPATLQADLRVGQPVVALSGTARQAAVAFPASANVAATLALATLGLDATEVEVRGGPVDQPVEHLVEAEGPMGSYRFELRNRTIPENPRTSALVPWSAVVLLERLAADVRVRSGR